jgi:hypothetical protein
VTRLLRPDQDREPVMGSARTVYDWFHSADPDILDCADLGCADVGIGIVHHLMCGRVWEDEDVYGPPTPEEEEMLPPDPTTTGERP